MALEDIGKIALDMSRIALDLSQNCDCGSLLGLSVCVNVCRVGCAATRWLG